MVARLLIREAGLSCDGSAFCESVVNEIALNLQEKKRSPITAGADLEVMPAPAIENLMLRRGLREFPLTAEALRIAACPLEIRPEAEEAVRHAMRKQLTPCIQCDLLLECGAPPA